MRLKETYDDAQRIELLKGNPISFTKYIFDSRDRFISDISAVYSGIYTRSNNKTISPTFESFYSYNGERGSRYIYFRPYHTDIETGEETFSEESNTSEYLIARDLRSTRTLTSYTVARYFIYDKSRHYLGYIPNYYLDQDLIFNTFPKAWYYTITILREIPGEPEVPYWKINTDEYTLSFSEYTLNWEYYLGKYIRNTFIDKWNKLYNALSTVYKINSPISITVSTDGSDIENKTNSYTDSVQSTNSGGNTNTRTFNNYSEKSTLTFSDDRVDGTERYYSGYKEKRDISTSEKTTVKETGIVEDYTFAYNSSNRVPTNVSEFGGADGDTTTTERKANDNKTLDELTMEGSRHDITKKKGSETTDTDKTGSFTDSNTYNGSSGDTHTVNGSDDVTKTYGKTITTEGHKGNIIEEINMELDLRSKNILLNEIYKDIDSIITLQIYA